MEGKKGKCKRRECKKPANPGCEGYCEDHYKHAKGMEKLSKGLREPRPRRVKVE